ncbi:MAG: hypothetical protein C0475_02825 [Planctomyces sp.]|nr:hypothetical protein [Planctomyces sp.]MBA4120574.1 hypothetical protein [Isosphaera sp.]
MASEPTGAITDSEGQVKWFDPKKGFGFIVGPEGQDIFAHYSKIEGEGFRVLRDGAMVRYDAQRGEKGWFATRVIRVDLPAAAPDGQPERSQPAPRTFRRHATGDRGSTGVHDQHGQWGVGT